MYVSVHPLNIASARKNHHRDMSWAFHDFELSVFLLQRCMSVCELCRTTKENQLDQNNKSKSYTWPFTFWGNFYSVMLMNFLTWNASTIYMDYGHGPNAKGQALTMPVSSPCFTDIIRLLSLNIMLNLFIFQQPSDFSKWQAAYSIQFNSIQFNSIQFNSIQFNSISLYCPLKGN